MASKQKRPINIQTEDMPQAQLDRLAKDLLQAYPELLTAADPQADQDPKSTPQKPVK